MPVMSAARQRVKQRAERRHKKGHATAHGREPPHTSSTLPTRDMRTGIRVAKALSLYMDRGLTTSPPSLISPSANNSCLTTDPSGILATCPALRVSLGNNVQS
eukprot:201744-Chlamydomonas_euryale.AAC.1